MKRLLTALLLALLPATVYGQATVLQGGSWTAGQVPTYSSTGAGAQPYVQQSGPAAGTGVGIKELSVIARGTGTAPYAGQGTGQLGTIFQIQDAPSSNATGYHALSFSANAQGGGLIAYNAFGGAAPLPLYMNVNGTTYEFPFAASGIIGPGTTVVGDIVCWNNVSGTLVGDCGKIGVALGSTAGGTANALTTTIAGVPSLAAGQTVMVNASAANTAIAPTLTVTLPNASVVGPLAITKFGGQALLPGDIFAANHRLQLMYTGSGFELMNPAISITADKINADNMGIGSADDTAIWQLIDTQIGSNSQLPKTVFVSKQTNVKNLDIQNIRKLEGIKDVQTFTLAASGTTSDHVLRYTGAGPFTADGLSIVCPVYNPATQAMPAGTYGLLIRPSVNVQMENITVERVRTTGCQNGIYIFQAMYVLMNDIFNDRPWGFGWVVSDQSDSEVAHTRHIRIRNTYGVNAGQYCGSLPVNTPTSTQTISPVNIDVQDVGCDGAGFINNKFCFDLTGTGFANAVFKGWGRNCFSGGMEIKNTAQAGVVPPFPNTIGNVHVEFDYHSNYDNGYGVAWVNQSTVDDPLTLRTKGRVFVTYVAPNARQPSTRYEAGAVFQSNSNVYKVATAGITDAGGGPSGTTNGITDGSLVVDYLQAVPATPVNIGAGTLRGLRDADLEYTYYDVAYGVVLNGTPDNTIANVNLKLIGRGYRTCLQDSNGAFTVSRLVLDGYCTVYSALGWPAIDLGFTSGMTYTDFELKGGPWRQELSGAAAGNSLIRLRTGLNFTGTISGGVHLISAMGIIYNETDPTLKIGGGGVWEVSSSSARAAIHNTTVSAGTITGDQVQLTSAVSVAATAYQAWNNIGGSTTAVQGRFLRKYSATSPTGVDQCNSGEVVYATAPGVGGQPAQGWYCSTPGNTWTAF